MRRFVLLAPVLLLPACQSPDAYVGNPFDGFGGFFGDTVTFRANPNRPIGDSQNMLRAYGRPGEVEPLLPEPGNVWPPPPKPEPTLADILQGDQNQGVPTTPGTPASGATTPGLQPLPTQPAPRPVPRGSSAPPAPVQPVVPPTSLAPQPAPVSRPPAPIEVPKGSVVQTPQGPAVISSGANGLQSYSLPNGTTGRVINNGNGTLTLIGSDGSVLSVPAPR